MLLLALLLKCSSLLHIPTGDDLSAAKWALGQLGRAVRAYHVLAAESHVLRPLAQTDRALVALFALVAFTIVVADLGAVAVLTPAAFTIVLTDA